VRSAGEEFDERAVVIGWIWRCRRIRASRRDRPAAIPVPGGILIGYARCSTERQDLTAQRRTLSDLGVPDDRVYLDHGLTGRNRSRPGLLQALAALREGDTLVVPKLDRLARSVPDARAIGDSLADRGVRLSLGGTVYLEFIQRDPRADRAVSITRVIADPRVVGDLIEQLSAVQGAPRAEGSQRFSRRAGQGQRGPLIRDPNRVIGTAAFVRGRCAGQARPTGRVDADS
jgi:Resolvase, N terminal domain